MYVTYWNEYDTPYHTWCDSIMCLWHWKTMSKTPYSYNCCLGICHIDLIIWHWQTCMISSFLFIFFYFSCCWQKAWKRVINWKKKQTTFNSSTRGSFSLTFSLFTFVLYHHEQYMVQYKGHLILEKSPLGTFTEHYGLNYINTILSFLTKHFWQSIDTIVEDVPVAKQLFNAKLLSI